jgi:protein TonB
MTQKNKKKRFINLPKYPGGSIYFKRFIQDNLIYPEEALQNGVEGSVYVSFTVNDHGEVIDARVTKGLGHGCDEEALRLVRLLKYERVKNRGVIVTSTMRTRINFRIKGNKPDSLNINYIPQSKAKTPSTDKLPEKKPVNYNYTIKL